MSSNLEFTCLMLHYDRPFKNAFSKQSKIYIDLFALRQDNMVDTLIFKKFPWTHCHRFYIIHLSIYLSIASRSPIVTPKARKQ